jgi:hypothetical protein
MMRSHLALVSTAALVAGLGLVGTAASAGATDGAAAARTHATSAAVPAKAGTSTTIGQLAPDPSATASCTTGGVVQVSTATPGQYVVPAGGGVVTSWSMSARAGGSGGGQVVFWTPASGGTYAVVAKSTLQPLTPSMVNTFPARIPVPEGALLGLHHSGTQACVTTAPGNLAAYAAYDPDTAPGPMAPSGSGAYLTNITATIESDADGDGYGDVTQDQCPQSAQTQAACVYPDTKVTKKPDKQTFERKPKIKFKSTVPGSTFVCAIDSNQTKPCSSPFKKRFGYGKHVLKIWAVSLGLTDPKPAKVKFTVLRPPD